MARGWESKGVADQIEEGKQVVAPSSAAATARERDRQTRLESLRLSRARVLDQLEKARQPAHRDMLLKGLASIEQQIEAISSETDKG
jgi:hypothetical protein